MPSRDDAGAAPRFVGSAEAGRLLGRHRSSIVRSLERGELPGALISGRWYLDLAALGERVRADSAARADLHARGRL